MRELKAFALCVVIILAIGGVAYAQHGIEVKTSVLFGAKLNLNDVGNIGAEGTGTMEWCPKGTNGENGLTATELGYNDFELVVTGEVPDDAKKVVVSPETTGYPILLEAGYTVDKFRVGAFWLGGFKAKGEAKGEVEGFDESNYYDFEEFIFQIDTENPLVLDAMIFFGGENMPVLPGMSYYWRHYSKAPDGDEEFYTLTADDITGAKYRAPTSHRGIGQVEWDVDPAKGATKWTSEVSFNLTNYGANVGYNVFDENNINVTAMVGLEKLGWSEEIKNTAKEIYDINFTTMDIKYGVNIGGSFTQNHYKALVAQLYGDIFGENPDYNAFVKEQLELDEGVDVTKATLENFSLHQASELKAARDIEVVRRLDYNPFGCSVGAGVGALVADKVRVNANLSLGWFSGDAKVKINKKDNRTAKFESVVKEGVGTWTYTIEDEEGGVASTQSGEDKTVEIPIKSDSGVWVPTDTYKEVAEGMDRLGSETAIEKTHAGTKVTMMKAQVSAEYDVTESIFVGGGVFYSYLKNMPVLSDTNALGIKTEDISASGINVEVGIRF